MFSEDRFGLATSSSDQPAILAFEEAVHGVGAHRPNAGPALGRALAEDPDHVGAHALKGFATLTLARQELMPVAREALGDARSALCRRDGGSEDERVLVEALALAIAGRFGAAATHLDAGFASNPAAFLPFKLSHALRFMLGDQAGLLAASRRMLNAWTGENPAAGFLLGCHAFALEEVGAYSEAEAVGRQAVSLQPEDAWGMHAVGHVHEMRGDTADGIRWLETGRGSWSRCNNFSFHMAWHLALLHLERGQHDRTLELYDVEVRPEPTDDFRDVANAVSLLWRLEHCSVDVGARWDELSAIARGRAADTSLMFASLHNLLAVVASGDPDAAADIVGSISLLARGNTDQARVACAVGLPLASAISDLLTHETASPKPDGTRRRDLDGLLTLMPQLGGSNAQRDVFVLALADLAARQGDELALARIRRARRRLKAEDRLIENVGRHAVRTA